MASISTYGFNIDIWLQYRHMASISTYGFNIYAWKLTSALFLVQHNVIIALHNRTKKRLPRCVHREKYIHTCASAHICAYARTHAMIQTIFVLAQKSCVASSVCIPSYLIHNSFLNECMCSYTFPHVCIPIQMYMLAFYDLKCGTDTILY
jgi:hypothetical protein